MVGNLLSSDLNQEAVKILFENMSKWDKRPYPDISKKVDWVYPNRLIGIADVMDLVLCPEYLGKWDMILINLPHRTLELLPKLIPLLDNRSHSLIRGRLIVEEKDIERTNQIIRQLLPEYILNKPKPELKIKRDYGPTLRLCSFEAWLK